MLVCEHKYLCVSYICLLNDVVKNRIKVDPLSIHIQALGWFCFLFCFLRKEEDTKLGGVCGGGRDLEIGGVEEM